MFNISKTTGFDSLIQTNELSENQPEFSVAASEISKDRNSNVVLRESTIIPDQETGVLDRDASGKKASTKQNADIISVSSLGTYEKLDLYPKVSVTSTEPGSIKMLSFDISMMKSNKQFGEQESSVETSKKLKGSPSTSKRQCRPLASTGKAREVDSFLGFESVFSFL